MPSITRTDIKHNGDLAKFLIQEMRSRVIFTEHDYQSKWDQWRLNDEAMVAYVPEKAADLRRQDKRLDDGDPQYTTIRVPYVYGVAMSLHSFLVSIFLSRSPVFQFEGIHGEGQNQVMALEALHDYQYRIGKIGPVLFCWFFDTIKYGVGIVGQSWAQRIRHVQNIVPQIDPLTQEVVGHEMVTERVEGYKGNEAFNVSPYDFLPDPRVPMKDFQKGEYCITRQRLSWQQIKEREMLGYYFNTDKIDPHIVPNFSRDVDRDRESRAIKRPSDNFYNLAVAEPTTNTDGKHKVPQIVPLYECYVKIVPKAWGLGNSDYPVTWVFTVTGDWKTLIGCAPYGSYWDGFPYHANEMEFDAHALVNRGTPEILEGVQETMDWLLNTHFFNVRASLNNLFVVDPYRINIKDLQKPIPGGIIRKRAGAPMSNDKAIEQLQIQDITRSNISDMELMKNVGEQSSGISDLLMGAVPTGGRRTATEARQTAAAGTSRGKTLAEYMGVSGMQSFAGHMVSNSQQYYDAEMRLRIVGNLAQFAGDPFVNVRPDTIAGQFDTVPVDGTLPLDRYAQLNVWKELLQGVLLDPTLAGQYDVAGIFGWMAQLGGLRNVNTFRIQPTQTELLQSQAQQGNVVPLQPGNSNPDNLTQPSGNVGPINVGSIYGQ